LVDPCGAKNASRRWGGRVNGASAAVTDDDGHFRMLLTEDFLAIDVEVTAHGYPGTVAALLAPGESLHRITVPSGTMVTGQLLLQGQPQPGQSVAVVQVNRGRFDRIFIKAVMATTDDDGRFQFKALPASEPYAIFSPVGKGVTGPVLPTMMFEAKENNATRDLGALDLVPGLTLAGRLQMTDGTKIPEGIQLTLDRLPAWDLIKVPTDKDGCFRIESLPPETYKVSLRGGEILLDEPRSTYQILDTRSFGFRLTESCIDLVIPIRHWRKGEAPLRRQVGPSTDTRGNQTLSGKVVDRNGAPVSGIKLGPYLVRGGRVKEKTTTTQADGTFTIGNLPDEPIELMFYDQSAFGYPNGVIYSGGADKLVLYPGRVRPQRNQSDIHIVFDPELTTPPVDLQ